MRKRQPVNPVLIGLTIDLRGFEADMPKNMPDIQRECSSKELKALRLASEISCKRTIRRIGDCRFNVPVGSQDAALQALLILLPRTAAEELSEFFPDLSATLLELLRQISIKRTIATFVEVAIARKRTKQESGKLIIPLYDEDNVDELLNPLKNQIRSLLGIKPGNNPKLIERIDNTRNALVQIAEKRGTSRTPTQEEVAKELGLGRNADRVRALRKWHQQCDLSWSQWLELCGWPPPEQNRHAK